MSADLKPDTRAEFEAWYGAAPSCFGRDVAWEAWRAATTAAQAKIAALEAELHEQARQNGMGSEREARLMARVAALRNAGAPMANTMFNLAQRDHWPAFERESFKAMQVAWDSAASAAGEAT